MTANPPSIPGDPYGALLAEVNRLRARIDAVDRRTLGSASVGSGGITINNGGSLTLGPGGDINLSAGGHIKDGIGDILFSADGTTGQRLSTPYLTVPMVPKWAGGRFQTNTGIGDYSIPASSVTAETTLWEGEAAQLLHPEAIWSGVLGRITGTTSTPTYRLYVNAVLVATNIQSSYAFYASPAIDITGVSVFGVQIASVKLTIQADISSADDLAFTVYGVVLSGR